MGLAAAGGG
ncbi:hypothetical protein YPPY92_4528, partial [Yersinia pestis PY-92]